jgi:hypothetical protein
MDTVKTMKTVFLPGLLCLAWLSPDAMAQPEQAEWTLLIYMDADNNLEPAGIDDFLEMAAVGSDENVNIVVQFDRHVAWDIVFDDWTDTRRGVINAGDEPDTTWGTSIGEVNMGDPQTLIDFVEWGMQAYPASRYAVVLWDHGSGWHARGESRPTRAVCSDECVPCSQNSPDCDMHGTICVSDDGCCADGDILFMQEVRNALQAVETDVQELDMVGFDACLMGMVEVAYEIRGHASVMVASERSEPNDGWPYDTFLADLVADPSMSTTDLGEIMVSRYYESYGNSQTHSMISLASMDALASTIDVFAQTLRYDWDADSAECAAAAHRVMMAVDSAVLAERHGSFWAGSHGLAVYFPEQDFNFDSDYDGTTIQFPQDTRWEEFLQDFYASMTGSWVADARDQSQEYNACPGGCPHHIDLYDFCERVTEAAPQALWVDFDFTGIEEGTFEQPYDTLAEAVAAAGSGETAFIKSGSSSETIIIATELTLVGSGGTVTIGQ